MHPRVQGSSQLVELFSETDAKDDAWRISPGRRASSPDLRQLIRMVPTTRELSGNAWMKTRVKRKAGVAYSCHMRSWAARTPAEILFTSWIRPEHLLMLGTLLRSGQGGQGVSAKEMTLAVLRKVYHI
ncbi:hypothetical protein GTR04_3886 [Trichophyton interdigitale]|uniref:Uncharacterized protein n=1 Tax=Trichophyton interdigitale TaxID=101480 RepID=A0A9P5CW02_9EURO|nr:hypothetical protein GY631_4449 [Trichophyton interdigitale]KAF3893040.1 hypothetical protein GY632_4411 [Trichophyton interdigitale]KAG8208748.1 hypothetical protein GTR04_3886 [Trichophyton interdigitale]